MRPRERSPFLPRQKTSKDIIALRIAAAVLGGLIVLGVIISAVAWYQDRQPSPLDNTGCDWIKAQSYERTVDCEP